ncbi:hypothetical protein YYC_05811 [Plasmodium yoelii 17X]|uniref:Uncharacterized protein n=1 Tax=Plasmodium yoelii 17X TaxID=1323249 RepID=V7PC85_PLAYE|nr:hypothetical protein YYC_05811 [Plasmodium yoelii 17X]
MENMQYTFMIRYLSFRTIIWNRIQNNNLCKIVLYIHIIKNVLNNPRFKCGRFRLLIRYLPDELNTSTEHDFHDNGKISNYCPIEDSESNKKCKTDFDKIKAGCLWLFEQLFVKNNNSNTNNVEYIMVWLSYMLTLKNVKNINNLKEFYDAHIKNNTYYINCDNNGKPCSDSLKEITGYTNYKEIIDNKIHFMTIGINDLSKFYDAFKLLCNLYNEITKQNPDCDKYLKCADEFVKKYKELNEDPNINKDNSYNKLFSTLLSDYNNLKNERNVPQSCKSVSLPEINTKNSKQLSELSEHSGHSGHSEHSELSEVTSSSLSISNKIFIVLSIFGAIAFFLGISYKVSNKKFKNNFHYIYAIIKKYIMGLPFLY